MLVIHEQKCQELCQAIEQLSERQEFLATVMERKKTLQKEALVEFNKQIFQEIKDLRNNCLKRTGSAREEAQFRKNAERKGACQNGRRQGQKEDLPPARNQHLEEFAEVWWDAKIGGGRGQLGGTGGLIHQNGKWIPDSGHQG